MKAEIVARDERENGERALLNLAQCSATLEAGPAFLTVCYREAIAIGWR
jgi:3-dehydroquinate synthetase